MPRDVFSFFDDEAVDDGDEGDVDAEFDGVEGASENSQDIDGSANGENIADEIPHVCVQNFLFSATASSQRRLLSAMGLESSTTLLVLENDRGVLYLMTDRRSRQEWPTTFTRISQSC